MTGLFATLLRCDACSHSVDAHSSTGCAECGCPLTRGSVIEANITTAVVEHSERYRYASLDERSS